jgi:alginate O-acetyltransferase complex protein AlgI
VTTEITDNNDVGAGRVLYDGDCGLCTRLARRFRATLQRRGFQLAPLQSRDAAAVSGATEEQLLRELHVVAPPDRRVLRGADAILFVARSLPWLRPLCWIARAPGMMPLLRSGYRFVANHRHCADGVCAIDPAPRRSTGFQPVDLISRWLPALLMVLTAALSGRGLTPWVYMWCVALSMYTACKWITWWPWRGRASGARQLAYLFLWPGMDLAAFFDRATVAPAPASTPTTPGQWLKPTATALIGALFIAIVAQRIPASWGLTRAWAAMLGLAMLLHFGLLDLIALAFRRAGCGGDPLMVQPLRSRSLGEFWGRRWNTGFATLAHHYVFAPLVRRIGATGATLATFFASGLIHDAVISVAARGGYGLPTLYFLIQCLGLLIERTRPARRIGLGRGRLGWLFTMLVTIAPLPLLFHAPFARRVILPFIDSLPRLPEVHMNALVLLLVLAGVLHLCITSAGLVMTLVLDWRKSLSPLCGLTRHIIWTHAGFVLLCIVGFGAISLLAAPSLASGAPLARAVCGFIALFWGIRLLIQFFLFDARPYLTSRWLAAGYHGLTVVFGYFALVYGVAAIH